MQVSVAGMAEVPDPDAALIAELSDIDQEGRDLVHRNHDVHLVDELRIRFNCREEAGTGGPGGFLGGAGGHHQHIQGACLFRNRSESDQLLIQLVLVAADESDQHRGAHVLVVHGLREDGVAGEGRGRGHDIRIHELNGLRVKVCHLDFRNKVDAALHIPERHQTGDVADRIWDQLHGHLRDNAERSL